MPVRFHVLPASCEPSPVGSKALQLKIVTFDSADHVYNPVRVIDDKASLLEKGKFSSNIDTIEKYSRKGLLKNTPSRRALHRYLVQMLTMLASNHSTPRLEDIRVQFLFSKLDFKSAFWQLQLHTDPHNMAVFYSDDKMYGYTRTPAQKKLETPLDPIFPI